MGLFDFKPAPVIHAIRKRSWWDGSVLAYCGDRASAGTYTETWFKGGITCPTCKHALKHRTK